MTTPDILLARWSDVSDRLHAVAREFPADKYDYQPTPEVRSFADQLRHVAFWSDHLAATMRGENPDGSANALAADAYPSKEGIVRALKASDDRVRAQIAKDGQSSLDAVVSFIEHHGEHYGQLIMYYRLNGLVPPASR
ncbi:MAG TPA: DinB family protein [Gemmatimonadaceae bacterium]|nr:DinB family protein [Gemmatimonadaceae bacterium]